MSYEVGCEHDHHVQAPSELSSRRSCSISCYQWSIGRVHWESKNRDRWISKPRCRHPCRQSSSFPYPCTMAWYGSRATWRSGRCRDTSTSPHGSYHLCRPWKGKTPGRKAVLWAAATNQRYGRKEPSGYAWCSTGAVHGRCLLSDLALEWVSNRDQ